MRLFGRGEPDVARAKAARDEKELKRALTWGGDLPHWGGYPGGPPAEHIRRSAAVALGSMGSRVAEPLLTRMLDPTDLERRQRFEESWVREEFASEARGAAWALGHIPSESAATTLRAAASSHPDADVRAEAAGALLSWLVTSRPPNLVEQLLDLAAVAERLHPKIAPVIASAGPGVATALITAAHGPVEPSAKCASLALALLHPAELDEDQRLERLVAREEWGSLVASVPKGIGVAIRALQSGRHHRPRSLASALVTSGAPAALDAVVEAILGPGGYGIIDSLDDADPGLLLDRLVPALNDAARDRRENAAGALGRMGEAARAALLPLLIAEEGERRFRRGGHSALAADGDVSPYLRAAARVAGLQVPSVGGYKEHDWLEENLADLRASFAMEVAAATSDIPVVPLTWTCEALLSALKRRPGQIFWVGRYGDTSGAVCFESGTAYRDAVRRAKGLALPVREEAGEWFDIGVDPMSDWDSSAGSYTAQGEGVPERNAHAGLILPGPPSGWGRERLWHADVTCTDGTLALFGLEFERL